MMTLLEQIQNELVDSNSDLGAILRKCKILAARLGSKPLEDWLIWESTGYPDDIQVPEHRQIPLVLKGNFSGPGGTGLRHAPIPTVSIPETFHDHVTLYQCRDSIAGIEHLLSESKRETFTVDVSNIAPYLEVYDRLHCLQCWGEFPTSALVGILNTVRSRVLDFVLALEKEDPKAGEIRQGSSTMNPAKVNQIFNMTIQGGVANVLGTVQGSSVTFNIQAGNFESLKTVLENNGVDKRDIEDLGKALAEDPAPTGASSFGPHVSAWIGNMINKAASGAWEIGLGAAGSLLAQAIARYYGLSP